ncbi:MAG: GntR family transcriptional regulator, partial [Moraxellaceae bacterium]|nr:GntR family transcriptional regulator [Moraxellaceae bacterium]
MAVIGRFNTLTVLRLTGHGAILDGHTDDGEGGDILLPTRLLPPDIAVGASVEVFVHFDSEDRVIATTQTPLAQVGDVAWLKIVAENDAGIFLDWGLAKDLMLPWNEVPREQKIGLEPGRSVLVMVFQDSSGRIAASARLDDF